MYPISVWHLFKIEHSINCIKRTSQKLVEAFTILLKKEIGVLKIIFYLKMKKIFETSHFFNVISTFDTFYNSNTKN
ncbi:hypothetical protein BpHYR1_038379 [Brachionus plicatilis]|uniref:Uncharacterized protein n=1 Tax=Brachionus plicatilis TaxID=10195 RepID=A0A3M7SPL3_BRAPC|nr:hypothetical protein BpHYR1_038379 [Brachionus plicatilis]